VNCQYQEQVPAWEPAFIDQCERLYRQGCEFAAAAVHCQRGEHHCKQFGACSAFAIPIDSNPLSYARRCCDVCLAGQNYYNYNSTCPTMEPTLIDVPSIGSKTLLTFEGQTGKLLQETFARSCAVQRSQVIMKRASNSDAFIDEENDKQFMDRCRKQQKCEHLCIDTGEEQTHCDCNHGYVLANDGHSCTPIPQCPGPFCPRPLDSIDKRTIENDTEDEQEPKVISLNAKESTTANQEVIVKRSGETSNSTQSAPATNPSTSDDLSKFKCVNGQFDPYLKACTSFNGNWTDNASHDNRSSTEGE
jgi:hypothetical protein